MELLIQRFDFMTAKHEQRSELSDELRRHDDKYEAVVTEDDLLAAYAHLRKGVCRPDYHGEADDETWFAKDVLNVIMEWAVKLMEEKKLQSLARLHDYSLQFLHDLLSQGPTTGHIKILCLLWNRDFGFGDYYKNMKGDQLKKHLRFLTREYKTHEPGKGKERFKIEMDSCFRHILGSDSFSNEAFEEARCEFIEMYLYMETSFLTRPKEVQDIHHVVSMMLWYKYNRNIFKGITDPEMIKRFLKRLEDIICGMNLVTADPEKDMKKAVDILGMILSAVSESFMFDKVHGEILDFVINICEKKSGSPLHSLVDKVGYFYYHLKDPKEGNPIIKGNGQLFKEMTTKLIAFLGELEDHTLMRVKFLDSAMSEVLVKAMTKESEQQQLLLDLVKACLRIKFSTAAKAAYYGIRECENIIKWKTHLDDAGEIMDLLAKVRVYGKDDRAKRDYGDLYCDLCDYMARGLKRDRVFPQLVDKVVAFSYKILDTRERAIMECAEEFVDEIDFNGKKNKELIMSIFKDLLKYLTDESFPWTGQGMDYGTRIVTGLAQKAIDALDSRVLKLEDYDVICHFVATAMKGDFIDHEQNIPMSVHYLLYCSVGTKFLALLDDTEKLQRGLLVIREIVKLMTHEYSEIVDMACNQVMVIANHGAKMLAPFFNHILDVYVDTEKSTLLYVIQLVYPHNPRPLEPHFQTIFELIDSGDSRSYALMILTDVAKRQPNLFTDVNVKGLIEEMYQGDERLQSQFLQTIDALATRDPKKVAPHLKTLIDGPINAQYGAMYYVCQILKNIAVRTDEETAETVMVFLEKHLREQEDQNVTTYCLNEMRAIGGVYRPLLEKRKPAIEDLRSRSNVQTTKDQCTFILDVLEGRSLESLAEEIKDVKEDVEELDTRVTQTEIGLVLVNHEVGQQKQELREVKTDVRRQGEKVDQLEEDVQDTKVKVEELDSKTLSHAPFWSRDVAKIMNVEDILDWRLLSSRLGYSIDDIRSWAQMHDPCMAMLNEWYATRKTSEATFAVLTALQEMDRMDAAVIVENAMKMAETVVEDEEFEYSSPPAVFLSYQWGIQNEVKLLKQHLEMAGYQCWMDIGQMGGGDKLFEKIDKGIRGAKLIISCVTEKYAKSPNCNREVNLSVGLGKPIIPLLMEKLSWPPPGSMGPIFSEYLFIRFFTRPGEETGDQRFWSAAKFQELLMQLNYNNVQPDLEKVKDDYKNWWSPVAEEIKIEKKNVKVMTSESQQKQQEVESGASSPDVFISYQWGKQKQIQILYKRLTELGFTCWMDIHQMGGGDSLYDKIDRGVRGAKVVVSCVTNKYSLSANCRREVSLADALKKPILPLLLEKMTWPPSGPMSMVFTQLLYISFSKDESVQERWDGPKFMELKMKLDQYVPNIILMNEEDSQGDASRSVAPPPVPAQPPVPAPEPEPEGKPTAEPKQEQANNQQGQASQQQLEEQQRQLEEQRRKLEEQQRKMEEERVKHMQELQRQQQELEEERKQQRLEQQQRLREQQQLRQQQMQQQQEQKKSKSCNIL